MIARHVLYCLSHTSSPFFDLVILEIGSCFFAQVGLDWDLLFILHADAGMIGVHHHTHHFSVEMGSLKLFCPGWPGTTVLPFSASQVTKITGMSHQGPTIFF
jgi:hypothetical protein